MSYENKRKFALWLRPDLERQMERVMQMINYKSKSQFINDAIEYYCEYIYADQCIDIMPKAIRQEVKEELYSYDEKHNRMLFKMCVELGILSSVVSELYDTVIVDDDPYFNRKAFVNKLRGETVEAVKHINGVIKFDEPMEVPDVNEFHGY